MSPRQTPVYILMSLVNKYPCTLVSQSVCPSASQSFSQSDSQSVSQSDTQSVGQSTLSQSRSKKRSYTGGEVVTAGGVLEGAGHTKPHGTRVELQQVERHVHRDHASENKPQIVTISRSPQHWNQSTKIIILIVASHESELHARTCPSN